MVERGGSSETALRGHFAHSGIRIGDKIRLLHILRKIMAKTERINASMQIYVDFDDCLCETARRFSILVRELFGKDIP